VSRGDRLKAVLILNRTSGRHARGRLSSPQRLRDAIEDLDRAVATLRALETTRLHLEDTASAHKLAASLYTELGQHDQAIDRMLMAEDLFDRAGASGVDFAKFLHDFAVTWLDLNSRSLAITYAERAHATFEAAGATEEAHRARTFLEALRSEYADGPPGDLDELRVALKAAGRDERGSTAQRLVLAIISSGDAVEYLAELHQTMRIALHAALATRRQTLDHVSAVLLTAIELYWRAIPLPTWLGKAVDDAIDSASRSNRLDVEGDLLAVRALCLLVAGDRAGGLTAALDGVTRRDEFVLTTETSMMRMITGHVSDYGRQVALATAIEDGNTSLAAELIETSRLQVEPARLGSPASTGSPFGRSRVGELHAVSVGGKSELADRYRLFSPKSISLEDAITATGGRDAHWWGTWMSNERVYWVVRLYGRWSAGTVAVAPGSHVSSLLQPALELSLLSSDASPAEVLAGPWCRSAPHEEQFAVSLGSELIPASLQLALEDAVNREEPLSLVVSGNLFAYLPVPLLAFDREHGSPVRVIEGAVLRVAAPAILTNRVAGRGAPRSDVFPIVAACVDPSGDLEFSGVVPTGARAALGPRQTSSQIPATRANLRASLPRTRDIPGIFYYSGHAAAGGLAGDDRDSLVLAAGETLSAAALFESAEAGTGPFFPSRTMLSACSSSGAAGAGAGEWLGLTAAVLWAGARQVVATNWPIWDTPFTSEFDLRLVQLLRRHRDVAAALRAIQLQALESWRESSHDLTRYEGEGMDLETFSLPFPLVWAAYSCVGVRD
jgi:tetratricopeptide (TPR) repeat protein